MKAPRGTTLSADRPFPGLRPFEFADREYFFGRRRHVLEIYRLLELSRFIAIIGSSGSGKSSLVRAGLLPLLEDEKTWKTVTLHPGDHPMAELTGALTALAQRVEDDDETHRDIRARRIELALQRSSFGIAGALAEIPALGDASVLILVDQFEELFRYTSAQRDEATFFVQSLLEATRSSERPIYVLITMRSDFIGDCARFNGLPEAVSAAQFLVPSLTRDEREEVIRKPIEKAEATIEPELVERLLIDLRPELDQLPVLSHCLARLWSRAENKHLTLDDYEAVGGIGGALSKHANEVMASKQLAGLEQGVELVFRALSDRDKEGRATRRALLFERLLAETGLDRTTLARIVDRFRADDCSFIVPSTVAEKTLRNDSRIDVVHEALLRRWNKISAEDTGWLAREEADGRFYRGLLAMLEGVSASAAVTLPLDQVEERWQRWASRPRTAAWAERYGGHFDRVERLLNDSRVALTQAREAERRRLEQEEAQRRERLELETRLAQQQARAAKLLAQRTRVLAAVMSLIAVLAIGAAIAAVSFGAESRIAEARANAEARAQETEADALRSTLTRLKVAQQTATHQAKKAQDAAKSARRQAEIARQESLAERRSERKATASATRESNLEHALALENMDYAMYDSGIDDRTAGLFGTDAYSADTRGGARDLLLTAAWTPYSLGRVALPPWSLGAVTNRGREAVVLAGERQRRYAQTVVGSLVAIDASTLEVLGRLPGVDASLLCGFDATSRVAVANGATIALYAVDGGTFRPAGRVDTGAVRAMACTPGGTVAYVDGANVLRLATASATREVTRLASTAGGIAVSSSGRVVAVTESGGDVALYELPSGRLLGQHRFFTSAADCATLTGCAHALAFAPDDKRIAWYDAGAVHVEPIGTAGDDSYPCPAASCNGVGLIYFAPGSTLPDVVASGGVLIPQAGSETTKGPSYALVYDDQAGAQRLPVADPEFNMYLTAYDPLKAQQPNPFHSGLAAQSFSRIDGPLIGTLPGSQWTGSYAMHGDALVMASGAGGFAQWDLARLRTEFDTLFAPSYRLRMYDSGDGKHAVAFDMMTGQIRVLSMQSGIPVTLHRFTVCLTAHSAHCGVPVKNNMYEYFVAPAYDPTDDVVTVLMYSTGANSFATLRKYSGDGRLLSSIDRAQLLRATGLPASGVVAWMLTSRGNYVVLRASSSASDVLIRSNGTVVGRAYSIDYVSPDERLAFGTVRAPNDYLEASFSLPAWQQGPFLEVPGFLTGLARSSDGRTIAYFTNPRNGDTPTLSLYDMPTHALYRRGPPNPPDVKRYSSLGFTADGEYLVAQYDDTSGNHRIAVYAIDPNVWARSACLMAGRSLTPQEFREYLGTSIPYRDGCRAYSDEMYRW